MMSDKSKRVMRLGAMLTVVLPLCLPAQANDSGWYIRDQQRESCEAQGGSYSYPNCQLPYDQSASGGSSSIIGGILVALIFGGSLIACRANGGCGASSSSSLGE